MFTLSLQRVAKKMSNEQEYDQFQLSNWPARIWAACQKNEKNFLIMHQTDKKEN